LTLWELREMIESSIPVWFGLLVFALCVVIVIVMLIDKPDSDRRSKP
jgi:hypothetical protein